MPNHHTFTINIEELTFETIIGILPKERIEPQKVIIDLSFNYLFDSSKNDFIDYSKVVELIKQTFHTQKFELIEEGLIFIEKLLIEKYSIKDLKLKITKPDILADCKVSVSLSK